MSDSEKHKFPGGTIEVLRKDILLIEYTSKRNLTAQDIIDSRDLRIKLIGNTPYYPIIDMRNGFVNFTKEAKKWVAENRESADIRIFDILLIPNWAMRIEAKMYLKIFKPINQTEIVIDIEKALEIINNHKNNRQK